MSASESSPFAANLHESIEQLVAETVRQSQTTHEEEQQRLRNALESALTEIESGQAALHRAAETLRAALISPVTEVPSTQVLDDSTTDPPSPGAIAVPETAAIVAVDSTPGPHELDVIAHNVTISIATGLQSMLRERPEVASAQTREFVNGELRLKLEMKTSLDIDALKTWITDHNGQITTHTESVIELRFGD